MHDVIDFVTRRYEHPGICQCEACQTSRMYMLLSDLERAYVARTVDEIIAEMAVFTDEQRSRAWCPEPPHEYAGSGDCRPGGNCGLDLSQETRHARWRQARFRMRREERAAIEPPKLEPMVLMADPEGVKFFRMAIISSAVTGAMAWMAYELVRVVFV